MRTQLSVVLLAALGCRNQAPDQTTVTVNNTLTITTPGIETITNTVSVPGNELQPEHYDPVLVETRRVQGADDEMELAELAVSDDRLAYCSATFGVIDLSASPIGYLAQGYEPGCAHLAWDEGDPDVVYTTLPDRLTGWDLAGGVPTQLPELVEASAFEGVDFQGGHIWVALHGEGLGVFERNPLNDNLRRVATYPDLENAWDVVVDGLVAYVADGTGGLAVLDVTDPEAPTELARLDFEGQARDIALDGDVAWVAAQGGGLLAIDVADPSAPSVLSTTGVNAIAVDADGERVFVAAWNDTRVYDATDAANPVFIGAARHTVDGFTDRVLAVAGEGDTVYSGTWSVPTVYEVHAERVAPYLVLPEADVGFPGDLAVGDDVDAVLTVRNEGTAPIALFDLYAGTGSFNVVPSELPLGIGGSGGLTLSYTATVAAEEQGTLQIWSDDPQQPVRRVPLVGNADGLGVGDLFVADATLSDGTPWSSADLAGKVAVVTYFTPGCATCTVELADLQASLYEPYADQQLEVVGLAPVDVGTYASGIGVGFPVGVETTSTGADLAAAHPGSDPYPIDVVVDRAGVIRYVAREYDAVGLEATVVALLAEP